MIIKWKKNSELYNIIVVQTVYAENFFNVIVVCLENHATERPACDSLTYRMPLTPSATFRKSQCISKNDKFSFQR